MSDLIATPGDPAANAYVDVAGADAYFEDHVTVGASATTWASASAEDKRRALIQATRELEAGITWNGVAANASVQNLAWPRLGLWDPDTYAPVPGTIIPDRVQWATAEQAAAILTSDRRAELPQQVQGVKRLQAGAVEIEFQDAQAGTVAVPVAVLVPAATQYVTCWGYVTQVGRGGTVPLLRT